MRKYYEKSLCVVQRKMKKWEDKTNPCAETMDWLWLCLESNKHSCSPLPFVPGETMHGWIQEDPCPSTPSSSLLHERLKNTFHWCNHQGIALTGILHRCFYGAGVRSVYLSSLISCSKAEPLSELGRAAAQRRHYSQLWIKISILMKALISPSWGSIFQ